MPTISNEVPYGIQVIRKLNHHCNGRVSNRLLWYRSSILLLTFMAYTCYHLSRKSISVVKNVLNQNCSFQMPDGLNSSDIHWCDWAPFNGNDSSTLLGAVDSSFLFAYAIAMYFSGYVAERVNLRYFLTFGMIMSGIFSYLFGLAYSLSIHSIWYFVIIQILAGIVQTTGWPGVVSVVGKWFGKEKRGLIFGIWNSHTSIGNILGSVIAGEFVETNWGVSFIAPGAIIAFGGFIIFLFLVENPSNVHCDLPTSGEDKAFNRHTYQRLTTENITDTSSEDSEDTNILEPGEVMPQPKVNEGAPILSLNIHSGEAIGFLGACKIPGVIEFSLCLFFAKLVSYTFLYWLPLYIRSSTTLGPALSGDLSTLFDVGGIVGGIAAGVVSDYTGMYATTCSVMLTFAAPMLFVYEKFGTYNFSVNIILLLIAGLLVNGPYALITTAVSAELGTHHSLQGNSKALATVTAIIDGTGSIGAAVGPLLAGVISSRGWENVFYMLIISDIIALMLLSRLVVSELRQWLLLRQSRS